MSRFSWRAEGEDSWSEADWPVEPGGPKRGRSWIGILLILALAGAAAVVVSRRVNERVEEATAAVTADLLSSFNLVRTAILHEDNEIFASLLSGRDKTWTEAQQAMFQDMLLVDRQFMRMKAILDETTLGPLIDGDPSIISLDFTPDLAEAEIQVSQPYTMVGDDGATKTVQLGHTFLFRRGSQRWLWSPPGAEYWGNRVRHETEYLSATYPERDSPVADRMTENLDEAMARLCGELSDISCPPEFHLTLRFATGPDSLLRAADRSNLWAQEGSLELPAIGLVGVPEDEAGYRALYRAYAGMVLSAAIARLGPWSCCTNAAIFGALVDFELSRFGLQPWPVTNESYERSVLEGIGLSEVTRYWSTRDPSILSAEEGWKIYLLIDFLVRQNPELTARDMMAEMSAGRPFARWLGAIFANSEQATGAESLLDYLDREWWAVAAELASTVNWPPPIPLPQQELLLLCSEEQDAPGPGKLLRYSLAADSWSETVLGNGIFLTMKPLPNSNQLLLSSVIFDQEDQVERWQMVLWEPGGVAREIELDNYGFSPGQMDPAGDYLVIYMFEIEDALPVAVLVDLASCQRADCAVTPLIGTPLWSPDGRHLILAEGESLGQNPLVINEMTALFDFSSPSREWRMWLAEAPQGQTASGEEPTEIASGFSPFWIDDQNYGYLVSTEDGSGGTVEALMVGAVDGSPSVRVVDSVSMSELLPPTPALPGRGGGEGRWTIRAAVANPANRSQLVLLVASSNGEEVHFILFDRQTQELSLLLTRGIGFGSTMAFSPDARWFIVMGVGSDSAAPVDPGVQLLLLDITTGQSQTYLTQMGRFLAPSNYDWSADGAWLAILANDRAINLVAPDYDYQQLILRPPSTCGAIAWATPQRP